LNHGGHGGKSESELQAPRALEKPDAEAKHEDAKKKSGICTFLLRVLRGSSVFHDVSCAAWCSSRLDG
jgi:hypothetical protein